jgi:membrane protein implicated in regulation of membrane protease activity
VLGDIDPRLGWLALGFVLAAAEIVAPGFFLIWLAGAALITGLALYLVPLGLPAQVILFAVLSVVALYLGKRFIAANPVHEADPGMNDRGARLVGETVTVTHALDGGTGRVKQGDSEWLAKGPDAAPGTKMRVTGHDGTVLVVEHLH